MKNNTYIYLSVAIVTFVLMVASAFLVTAADAPIREASGYITLFFGVITTWCVAKTLLSEREAEMRKALLLNHSNA